MQNISAEVIARASQGDMASFEELYKATASFVYNVALRVVNNRQDAEEVAQEVFLAVYRKLKDFRFEASFKTWVYRITVNRAINFSKKNSRMKMRTVEYDDRRSRKEVYNDVEEHIDKEERQQAVGELLATVNPVQRACVVLRDIQGLSYQEIAQALKININTVRSRLKRAREKMLAFKREG